MHVVIDCLFFASGPSAAGFIMPGRARTVEPESGTAELRGRDPASPAPQRQALIILVDAHAPPASERIEQVLREAVTAGTPVDVVPVGSTVAFLSWASTASPVLLAYCHIDGPVQLSSPGWWVSRIDRWLSAPPEPLPDLRTTRTHRRLTA